VRIFGVDRGSGYAPKEVVTQSPLVCPKCGKPASGTRERLKCNSCGFADGVQEKAAPALGVVDNPCGQCGAPLTIVGDRKSCHGCGWSL
jgi:exosome complex RNA-binding protein Csl4